MTLGETIRRYRELKGFSQADMAEKMGIKAPSYTVYETGARIPKIEVRMQIAKILEIDPLLIFDMDLTYTDKQRLLMKLLFDCTPNISVNSDGHVVAVLPEEFDAFGEMFLTYINSTSEIDASDKNRIGEITDIAQSELKYWMDTWPRYDYLLYAKEKGINPEIGGNYSVKNTMLKELAGAIAKERENEKKINDMITYAFDEGISKDVLIKRLQDRFHLSEESAKEKIAQYELFIGE